MDYTLLAIACGVVLAGLLWAAGAARRNGTLRSHSSPGRSNYAANAFGRDQAFRGACRELLTDVLRLRPGPIFDAVLIDEAQDLPLL
jgi:superfamily I DNA and RNA helicase